MAAAAILQFFLTATTRLLLNIFAQNLAKRLETSRKQFYVQISLLRKSKMAAAAIFKIGLRLYLGIIWLIFVWNFANGLKMVSHKRFCCKNSLSAKSKMAAATILEFTLTVIALICTNLAQRHYYVIIFWHSVMMTRNFSMRKYSKRIFAVFYV